MDMFGGTSSDDWAVWRYGVKVVGGAVAGLAARDRERFSRGRPWETVFLDEGAMMGRSGSGVDVAAKDEMMACLEACGGQSTDGKCRAQSSQCTS